MEKYNRWTIISHDAPRKDGAKQVLVRCDCGVERIHKEAVVKYGISKSCGCLMREKNGRLAKERNTVHGAGANKPRLYNIWRLMRQRCNNVNASGYNNYGGRGIKVSSEWDTYPPFKEWALANGYNDEMTIERIDKDGNYEHSNCEWITRSENIARRNASVDDSKKRKSRFSEQDIQDMKEMRENGQTLEVVAGAFGTNISHVSRLVKGQYKYTNG